MSWNEWNEYFNITIINISVILSLNAFENLQKDNPCYNTPLSGINISIPSIIPTLALFTNSNIDGVEVEEF